tara:strand:- start:3481 stop:4692 length:1212 start_codon:yes stop_codon:yes gene_type:complete
VKYLTILGSTGSIGTQTLELVDEFPEKFQVAALTAGRNIHLLIEQISKYHPEIVSISCDSDYIQTKSMVEDLGLKNPPKIVCGLTGAEEVASFLKSDIVVTGIVGCAGLLPTMAAIKAGKDIALANKETLIAAGPIVIPALKQFNSKLLPADSEHSAIFQCLQGAVLPERALISSGEPAPGLRRILLTASGGAFRDWDKNKLNQVTVADATSHPNWSMGQKITVDSATLMNKGLEVIEAHYLFGIAYDNIEINIHPQSIIHSLIELNDSSVLAQLGWPDMKLPILYALSWPERISTKWKRLNLSDISTLTFKEPDKEKYPCMELAYSAGREGGTMPAVLNASNEEAVSLFLKEKINFLEIPKFIEKACNKHHSEIVSEPSLEEIIQFDNWARIFVRNSSVKNI